MEQVMCVIPHHDVDVFFYEGEDKNSLIMDVICPEQQLVVNDLCLTYNRQSAVKQKVTKECTQYYWASRFWAGLHRQAYQ